MAELQPLLGLAPASPCVENLPPLVARLRQDQSLTQCACHCAVATSRAWNARRATVIPPEDMEILWIAKHASVDISNPVRYSENGVVLDDDSIIPFTMAILPDLGQTNEFP